MRASRLQGALVDTRRSTASVRTSDLVAAIDQAVADGVDVINYSVSGTTTNFLHRSSRVPLCRGRRRVRRSVCWQQRPTTSTSRTRPVAHYSRGGYTQPKRTGLRDSATGSRTRDRWHTSLGPPLIDSTRRLAGADRPGRPLLRRCDNAGVAVIDPQDHRKDCCLRSWRDGACEQDLAVSRLGASE